MIRLYDGSCSFEFEIIAETLRAIYEKQRPIEAESQKKTESLKGEIISGSLKQQRFVKIAEDRKFKVMSKVKGLKK